jgi:hypothetical protein
LSLSPDRALLLVRGIESGDDWSTTEFGWRYRPRLYRVDLDTGDLVPLTTRAGYHVWFHAGGVFFTEETGESAELRYLDRTGGVTSVLADFAGLSLDAPLPIASTSFPRQYRVFDPQTLTVRDLGELVPWTTDATGHCVLGWEEGALVLLAGDERSELANIADGSVSRVQVDADCTRVLHRSDDTIDVHDLEDGDVRRLEGRGIGRLWWRSPSRDQAYFVDEVGLHRVDLANQEMTLLFPAMGEPAIDPFMRFDNSPDGRYTALGAIPYNWCYHLVLLDLVEGTFALGGTRICPEIVGYAHFSPDSRHLDWVDAPYNARTTPVGDFAETEYCPAMHCLHAGSHSPDGRWVVAPWSEEGGFPLPVAHWLAFFDHDDPDAGLVPMFAAQEPYDPDWRELVRFSADSQTMTFGEDDVMRALGTGPCPATLRAGPPPLEDHWVLADEVVDVEIAANDLLAWVAGPPREDAYCPGWPEPPGFESGLHLLPPSEWKEE